MNYYFERLGKGASYQRPGVGTRSSPARDALVIQTIRGIWRKHGRPLPIDGLSESALEP
jgi:hypothetical protein